MESKYRVLKVDRTDHRELIIHDDGITYTQKEIKQMLQMIDVGNRTKQVKPSKPQERMREEDLVS